MNRMTQVSASTIGIMRDCPKCFWMHFHHIELRRPRGIFPSLPGGIDLVLKTHYDNYRGKLPPEIDGLVRGILMKDIITLNEWRNWRKGLQYQHPRHSVKIVGALDDCLQDKNIYIPLDFKTKGSKPKSKDYGMTYYQHQVAIYNYLLKMNGYKVADTSFLIFYYPVKTIDNGLDDGNGIRFDIDIQEVKASWKMAELLFNDAIKLINDPISPGGKLDCEYCNYRKDKMVTF